MLIYAGVLAQGICYISREVMLCKHCGAAAAPITKKLFSVYSAELHSTKGWSEKDQEGFKIFFCF